MKKILITGFEPFQKEVFNPSQKLADILREQGGFSTLILPVSYQRSWEALREHLEKNEYHFVLMLGQAGGRGKISLEKTALNLQDADTADEDGDLRLQQRISAEGPDAFLSPLPLRCWLDELKKNHQPFEISLSAGAFVCNSIYYQTVEYLKKKDSSTQALFVHVPYMKEQLAQNNLAAPHLELQAMKRAIDELLKLVCNE